MCGLDLFHPWTSDIVNSSVRNYLYNICFIIHDVTRGSRRFLDWSWCSKGRNNGHKIWKTTTSSWINGSGKATICCTRCCRKALPINCKTDRARWTRARQLYYADSILLFSYPFLYMSNTRSRANVEKRFWINSPAR